MQTGAPDHQLVLVCDVSSLQQAIRRMICQHAAQGFNGLDRCNKSLQ